MSQSKSRIVQQNCRHPDLTFSLSAHAKSAGHQAYTDQQILNAMTGKRKHAADAAFQHHLDAFPDVLVLPGDAIDLDPKYPPQSFRSWLNEGTRNQVTTRRNTIYVAAPPEIDSNVKFMKDWYQPEFSGSSVLGCNARWLAPSADPSKSSRQHVSATSMFKASFRTFRRSTMVFKSSFFRLP